MNDYMQIPMLAKVFLVLFATLLCTFSALALYSTNETEKLSKKKDLVRALRHVKSRISNTALHQKIDKIFDYLMREDYLKVAESLYEVEKRLPASALKEWEAVIKYWNRVKY